MKRSSVLYPDILIFSVTENYFKKFLAWNSGAPAQGGRLDFAHSGHPIPTPLPVTASTRRSKKKGKGSPYSITERRVPEIMEMIPVLGGQPAGDVSHKPDGGLPLLSAMPAVTPATLKRAATSFADWRTEAQWV